MKIASLAFVIGSVSAFAPVSHTAFRPKSLSMAVVTGPKGKAASSKEQDLELTREVIMAHIDEEPAAAPAPAPVDEPESEE